MDFCPAVPTVELEQCRKAFELPMSGKTISCTCPCHQLEGAAMTITHPTDQGPRQDAGAEGEL